MVRALLLVLACAGAAVAGTSYGDYASIKLPNYGAADYDARAPAPPPDDYRDQVPDAQAPLDYKYEEIPTSDKIDENISNDVEDDNLWKKPMQIIRKQKNHDDADPEAYKLDKVVPKFQAMSHSKNRARYRNKSKAKSSELLSRRHRTDDENQQIDIGDEDSQTHAEDLNGDNNLEPEYINNRFVRKEINKKIRRKPRERPNLETRIKSDVEDEDIMSDVRDIQKSIRGSGPDYPDHLADERQRMLDVVARDQVKIRQDPEEDEPQRMQGQSRELPSPQASMPPRVPMPPQTPMLPGVRLPSQTKDNTDLNDYADYYDMNRVQNIKSKLPPLLRRTKVKEMASDEPQRSAPWRTRKPSYRRKNFPSVKLKASSVTAAESIASTTTSMTICTSVPQAVELAYTPKELSIAEKSRLSILKKAQRKISFNNGSSTNKPPVLLQVTQRLHTVVIVEPPMQQDPWLRAKEISDDSPERLEKVKRLMRRKLVSNAKNIRDLTDNWDEMICDYVDVSLIDKGAAPTTKINSYFSLALSVTCFIYFSMT